MKSINITSDWVAVIDCNNFFVSCERVFRPDLATRPVIVMSSNDGCVVARSQEVKDLAIPMGTPVFMIKDIIKTQQIVRFSSNFTLYRDFSKRVFAIIKAQFQQFEQYSIDEAFVSLIKLDQATAQAKMLTLKQEIFKQTGIPVSVGIGQTKTQAKYASTLAKKSKSGVFVCDQAWWQENAQTVAIGDIWGVGKKLQARYHRHGIFKVADLLITTRQKLQTIGGVVAVRLQSELSGMIMEPICVTTKLPQSLISSRSFGRIIKTKSILLEALIYHLHNIVSELEIKKLLAVKIAICIVSKSTSDNWSESQLINLPIITPTRDIAYLLRGLLEMVDINFSTGKLYKKAGVYVQALVPDDYSQARLFAVLPNIITKPSTNNSGEQVHNLLYELRAKYGQQKLAVGLNTKNHTWQAKRELCSPAYTTNWSQLRIVSAKS